MSEVKTSRLLNLLIALLHTERGISRERILKDIYGETAEGTLADAEEDAAEAQTVLRKFERDKSDLRDMGAVIIESEGFERMDSAKTVTMYRIDPQGFRLPPLTFSPEESTWLALAALACDDAVAGADAQRALHRLEAAGALPETPPSQVQPRVRLDPHWTALSEATARCAEVGFDYHASSTGQTARRRVQPWGLGHRYGQWYLVGHDLDREAVRLFRLSRIRGAVSAGTPGSFAPPPGGAVQQALAALDELPEKTARLRIAEDRALDLRRQWEPSGPGPAGWDLGGFRYRDLSVAAERIVAFGDAVVVEGPSQLAEEVVARLRGTLEALGTPGAAEAEMGRPARRITNGPERLERLMDIVPFLLQGPVTVAEVAERLGVSPKKAVQELGLLADAGPTDMAGFQSYIEILIDDGVVTVANAEELSRPRRLDPGEAVSLQLGLKALLPIAGRDAAESLLRLADRVAAAAVGGGRTLPQVDMRTEPLHGGHLLPLLSEAARDRGTTLRITYLNPTKDERTERLVSVFGVISDGNRWYVNSYCHRAQDRRMFRVDRILEAAPADPLPVPEGFSPGAAPGAVFTRSEDDLIAVVRLAPEARWVEDAFDTEDGRELTDGSRRVHLRVADTAWLAAFLAPFGGAVALEGPGAACEGVRSWLVRALALYGEAPRTS